MFRTRAQGILSYTDTKELRGIILEIMYSLHPKP